MKFALRRKAVFPLFPGSLIHPSGNLNLPNSGSWFSLGRMTAPVALIFYENLLAGGRLVNRMQDLGYRVQLVSDLRGLVDQALSAKPMVLVANLSVLSPEMRAALQALRGNPATRHIPVIAFIKQGDKKLAEAMRLAGATLVASEAGITKQLPQLLEQALQVE
jgi:CheY-like chemotaxis protein